jgi:hypothetical protein
MRASRSESRELLKSVALFGLMLGSEPSASLHLVPPRVLRSPDNRTVCAL